MNEMKWKEKWSNPNAFCRCKHIWVMWTISNYIAMFFSSSYILIVNQCTDLDARFLMLELKIVKIKLSVALWKESLIFNARTLKFSKYCVLLIDCRCSFFFLLLFTHLFIVCASNCYMAKQKQNEINSWIMRERKKSPTLMSYAYSSHAHN